MPRLGVFCDCYLYNFTFKIRVTAFRPTQIRYASLLTYEKSPYYTSDLLARGFTAAKWTCGRSAPSHLAAALGPEIVLT